MATRARTPLDRADADSRVPRYLQVASVLRRRIRDGHWPVGAKIATLEELEHEFGVARVTVRQAIDLLQGEGLVKSFQGRGTFVTKAPEHDRWIQLATDWESLIAPIRDSVPHFLPSGEEPPPRIEEGDGVPAEAYVYLAASRSRPAALRLRPGARRPSHPRPRAEVIRVPRRAGGAVGDGGSGISRAHQTLAIGAADMETARNLGIALNAPTAEARCVVTDAAGTVIYVGEITYPGDCVRLNIELIGQGRG